MFTVTYAQKDFKQRKKFIIDRPNGIPVYDLVFFKTKTNIESDGEMNLYGKNTMILYDKFSKQYYSSAEECLISDFIHFETNDIEDEKIFENLIFDKPFYIEQAEVIENIFRLLTEEHNGNCSNREINSSEILKVLLKKYEEEIKMSKKRNNYGRFSGIISAKNKIMQNPQYNWNIEGLAEECSMSKSSFQLAYKKLFGTNVIGDVIKARLEMAKELILNTPSPIHEIASHCGYNNIEHFSRQFKKKYGVTPLKLREGV